MRFLIASTILALLPTLCAADEPKFQVPKSWQKVTTGLPAGPFLTARDGYAVAIGSAIVKGTEHNRAQSFTNTVYRFKVGSDKPEELEQRVTTHVLVALLGPKGMIATGHFADYDTIHLPGHKPIKLPKGVRFVAHHFTADGLVCSGEIFRDGKYHSEIVLFPLDLNQGELSETQVLQGWFPTVGADGFKPDYTYGRVFYRGDFVAYTGELLPWAPHGLVVAAAVSATVTEAVLAIWLASGWAYRWAGKAAAGLLTVYLVVMGFTVGLADVATYAVPLLVGGALLTSVRPVDRPLRS